MAEATNQGGANIANTGEELFNLGHNFDHFGSADCLPLYKEAADKGSKPAALRLAQIYGDGLFGVEADKGAAEEWRERGQGSSAQTLLEETGQGGNADSAAKLPSAYDIKAESAAQPADEDRKRGATGGAAATLQIPSPPKANAILIIAGVAGVAVVAGGLALTLGHPRASDQVDQRQENGPAAILATTGPAQALKPIQIYTEPTMTTRPRGLMPKGATACVTFVSGASPTDKAPIVQMTFIGGTRFYARNRPGAFQPDPSSNACKGVRPTQEQ